MASELQVITVDGPAGLGATAAALVADLERRWSRFVADSDVSRLNAAGGRPVPVHADTLTLVATMVEAWRLTAGRYDPTLLPALVRSGYAASIEDPRSVTPLPVEDPGADPSLIEIDGPARTVTLPTGLSLDPGGIGKGLAADIVVGRLLDAGAAGALVSIGGDMSMAGRAPLVDGWIVAIEDAEPHSPELGTIAVSGGGVATSSTRSRRWMQQGIERHHLVDPRTRSEATTDLAAVTVVAPTAWLAEAHATAALLVGGELALDHLRAHDLTGLAIGLDGTVRRTDDLAEVGIA